MITDRYYYMQLAEPEKRIYQTLYKGVVGLEKEISLGMVSAPMEMIDRVFHAVTADNPFLYYFNQSVLDMKQSPFETILMPQYFYDRERIETYNERIENIVNQFMHDWKLAEVSESEKVRRVHDYFCQNISYDTEALSTNQFHRLVAAHSIIGVFARKRAVCEGVAKAVKLILNTAGVKCIVVDGLGGLEEGKHAWNMVKIDGASYHLDLTWDLANTRGNHINYDYYNLTDADILRDHSDFDGVPVCCAERENYFVKNGLEFQNRRQLDRYIQRGLARKQTDFYFRYRGKEDIEWLLQEEAHFLQTELPKHGMQGRISSTMKQSQGTGRIKITLIDV
ncbi:MAG: hypothetical protein LUE92_01300 [Clostridiales bacterium]|nr:hypothetical protein [Clostridiales bacterium]